MTAGKTRDCMMAAGSSTTSTVMAIITIPIIQETNHKASTVLGTMTGQTGLTLRVMEDRPVMNG